MRIQCYSGLLLAEALVLLVLSTAAGAQSPAVTVTLVRTVADAGTYPKSGYSSKSNSVRRAVTGAAGLQWRPERRLSFTAELGVMPRGFVSGTEWLNATFVEGSVSADLHLAASRRRVRPYIGYGLAAGVRLWCARGNTTISGKREDDCDGDLNYDPPIATTDVSREIRAGVRVRIAGRQHALEFAHLRSLDPFERYGLHHRVLVVRVRACVHNC